MYYILYIQLCRWHRRPHAGHEHQRELTPWALETRRCGTPLYCGAFWFCSAVLLAQKITCTAGPSAAMQTETHAMVARSCHALPCGLFSGTVTINAWPPGDSSSGSCGTSNNSTSGHCVDPTYSKKCTALDEIYLTVCRTMGAWPAADCSSGSSTNAAHHSTRTICWQQVVRPLIQGIADNASLPLRELLPPRLLPWLLSTNKLKLIAAPHLNTTLAKCLQL